MKKYFLTEEQYCNNTIVRFYEKNHLMAKRLNGSPVGREFNTADGDKLKN
ncbi:hypothetical protein PVA17_12845 [Lysinibacillus sp. CNPSo 3705]|nr:hypothetical protein [Lysinibacillus sp. CNPSo 3705]MDD1503646.1 hypothetical protein [Lysinibacillus sp. CNPSo 3705]